MPNVLDLSYVFDCPHLGFDVKLMIFACNVFVTSGGWCPRFYGYYGGLQCPYTSLKPFRYTAFGVGGTIYEQSVEDMRTTSS